jgi:hypothetical protein
MNSLQKLLKKYEDKYYGKEIPTSETEAVSEEEPSSLVSADGVTPIRPEEPQP